MPSGLFSLPGWSVPPWIGSEISGSATLGAVGLSNPRKGAVRRATHRLGKNENRLWRSQITIVSRDPGRLKQANFNNGENRQYGWGQNTATNKIFLESAQQVRQPNNATKRHSHINFDTTQVNRWTGRQALQPRGGPSGPTRPRRAGRAPQAPGGPGGPRRPKAAQAGPAGPRHHWHAPGKEGKSCRFLPPRSREHARERGKTCRYFCCRGREGKQTQHNTKMRPSQASTDPGRPRTVSPQPPPLHSVQAHGCRHPARR